MVIVNLRLPSGEKHELDLSPDDTVTKLLASAALAWGVSTRFIIVLFDGIEIAPKDKIAKYASDADGILDLVGVISFEPVLAELRSSKPDLRIRALKEFLDIGPRAKEQAFDVVAPCLQDDSKNVRELALMCVLALAGEGDPRAIEAAAAGLESENKRVRCFAVEEALVTIAGRGNPDAVAAVAGRLEHNSVEVRHSAAAALAKVAEVGDEVAICALAQCCANFYHEIPDRARFTTSPFEFLKELGKGTNNMTAVAVLCELFECTDEKTREEAIGCIQEVSEEGNRGVISRISSYLTHTQLYTRCCAVEALAGVAEEGDRDAIGAAGDLLASDDAAAKIAAVGALADVAHNGDPAALASVQGQLDDGHQRVRVMAMVAFGSLAKHGDKSAVAVVDRYICDDDIDMRTASLEAFARVAEKPTAVARLLERLEAEDDPYVLGYVLETLAKFELRGHQEALAKTLQILDDESKLAGDDLNGMTTGREGIACKALETLGSLVVNTDTRSISEVRKFLEHRNFGVREVAQDALDSIEKGSTAGYE